MKTTICPHCDLSPCQPIRLRWVWCCPRCRGLLAPTFVLSHTATISLSATALLLFIPTLGFAVLTFDVAGTEQTVNILSALAALHREGQFGLVLLLLLTLVLAPIGYLTMLMLAVTALALHQQYLWIRAALSFAYYARHWIMLDVFVLSMAVALVKLLDHADVQLGIALLPLLLQCVLQALLLVFVDWRALWQQLVSRGH